MRARKVQPRPPTAALPHLYRSLLKAYGPQQWWPARTRFETIVGAFLTQNTSWKNVERALANLRAGRALTVESMSRIPVPELEILLRPSGYYRQKTARLKGFLDYLRERHRGSLRRMFTLPLEELREELLTLNGVGPETADSILLYAGGYPVFIIDTYARRVLMRHDLYPDAMTAPYSELRAFMEAGFLRNSEAGKERIFNEFHALIVQVGKLHCGTQPKCEGCPLQWHRAKCSGT